MTAAGAAAPAQLDGWSKVGDTRFSDAPGTIDVEITERDPGSTPHFDVMVAGRPEEIGQGKFGGLGIGACGAVVDNSISMVFANSAGAGDPRWLCYAIAQETAHNFGLDHELVQVVDVGAGARLPRDAEGRDGAAGGAVGALPRGDGSAGATQDSAVARPVSRPRA